jgi:hypothetical protein
MCLALWFVQIVHYPMLARMPAADLPACAAANIRRTTWVLGPVMLFEMLAACRLAISPPPAVSPAAAWTGLALLSAAWLSTAIVQVPVHRRLALRRDEGDLRMLSRTNWLRTILWSARAALALSLL